MTNSNQIVIKGFGSISPLGHNPEQVRAAYTAGKSFFELRNFSQSINPVSALSAASENQLNLLKQEKRAFETVDKTVLMAIFSARQAIAQAGWHNDTDIAVNIGSSRGATHLLEEYISEFNRTGNVPAHTSPVTTLGNISSWVANDLQTNGPQISHSVTCSTALQAIANGFAWLKSGMATKFLAGGSEAPLTAFTIAQMKAIGIYSEDTETTYPCRPQNKEKKNTFVLGEGAAVFALEKYANNSSGQALLAVIEGIGFGFEEIKSKTGISRIGQHFQKAMQQALAFAKIDSSEIDLIIMHAPGTAKGDAAELTAIKSVFGEQNTPLLTSNKWLIGHTLGASAALSLEYAIYLLQTQQPLSFPFPTNILPQNFPEKINCVMILAAGFGGNATALILSSSGK